VADAAKGAGRGGEGKVRRAGWAACDGRKRADATPADSIDI